MRTFAFDLVRTMARLVVLVDGTVRAATSAAVTAFGPAGAPAPPARRKASLTFATTRRPGKSSGLTSSAEMKAVEPSLVAGRVEGARSA
jgi:hypothetical protein